MSRVMLGVAGGERASLAPYVVGALLFIVPGCDGSRERGIHGLVCTKPGINSYSYRQTGVYMPEDCQPVPRAKISLAFDDKGEDKIKGREATADANGKYTIDTKKLPRPKDRYGFYYLVVEKEGYERYVMEITVGSMSSYQKNTIVLKEVPKKQAREGEAKPKAEP